MGCCLLGLWCFDHFVETFVTRFVVVPLFPAVSTSNYDSAFLASTSLRWLLLVPYGSSYRLALIYSPFTFITALCSSLRGPGYLFVQFSNYCNYLGLNTLLPHRVLRLYSFLLRVSFLLHEILAVFIKSRWYLH